MYTTDVFIGSVASVEFYDMEYSMAKKQLAPFSEVEEHIQSGDYSGWCTNCGDWTHDSCEPDAHNYECPECERNTCYGAEELLVQNLIDTTK